MSETPMNKLRALCEMWREHADSPIPTDRAIGYLECVDELRAILPDVEHEEAEAEALRQQSDYFQSEVDAATERERMLVEALRECVQSMAASTNVTFGCLPKARVTLALFDQPVAPKEMK